MRRVLYILFLFVLPQDTRSANCGANLVSIDGGCVCVSGYFCPSGGVATLCPTGYTSNLGSSNVNECYVPHGALVNLTIDFVAMNTTESMFLRGLPPGVGLVSYEDELLIYVDNCPTGYWCEDQTGMPTACPAGTYQPDLGAESATACLTCPLGHYCAAATTTPSNCPGGTYGNATGLTPGECQTCVAGTYCPPGSSAATPAPAGTYISADSASSLNDAVSCPRGSFCPEGATAPTLCGIGTYLSATGGASETDCTTCPAGSYCGLGAGEPVSCPAGTYNGFTGSVSSSSCATCLAGAYCGVASTSPTQCVHGTYSSVTGAQDVSSCLACPAGHFCGTGSVTPSNCAAGTSRSATGGTSQSSCAECAAGYYCPAASVEPSACGPGTYSMFAGSMKQQDCVLCQPGTYSIGSARSTICPACAAMSYCPTSTTLLACPSHTSSPEGSYSVFACTCDDGYDCLTKKEIHATVRLNTTTASDFNADVDGVRTNLISAFAHAANVTDDKVTILQVLESARRRLLSMQHTNVVRHPRDVLGESMRVRASLKQELHLRNLRKRMAPALARHYPKETALPSVRNAPAPALRMHHGNNK